MLIICVSFVFLGLKINGQPVFKVSQKGLSKKEVIDICIACNFHAKKVCRKVAHGVTESAIFIVDLNIVNEGDLTTDGNGVYARHSCPTEVVRVDFSSESRIKRVSKRKKGKILKEATFFLSSVITAGMLLQMSFAVLYLRYMTTAKGSLDDMLLYSIK